MLGAIVLATALVIAAWRFGGEDTPRVQGVNTTLQTAAAKNAAAGKVTLLVTAAKGPTFMEVRVGSPTGTPLFSGTLEKGRSQRFTKKTLYISVARPDNVIVKVDGRKVLIESDSSRSVAAQPSGDEPAPRSRGRHRLRAVRGERTDLNGPFYMREALRLGLQLGPHHHRG